MKFTFNWKDGTNETVEMSDCNSVEEAVNSRCGSNTVGLESCTIVEDTPTPEGA